jgi:hypothetical protein
VKKNHRPVLRRERGHEDGVDLCSCESEEYEDGVGVGVGVDVNVIIKSDVLHGIGLEECASSVLT